MEKVIRTENNVQIKKQHSITLEGRKKISMTGVEKVIGSNENLFSLSTTEGGITIQGKNLKINSFNVADGTFSAEGEVDSIKYTAAKSPILKRMFK